MPGPTTQRAHVDGYGARRYGLEIMNLPPCSSSLSSGDLYLFGPLTNDLVDKQFATDHDMKQAVFPWLQKFYTDFLYTGIQALASQWDKCLNICGDYVEVWRVPYNMHVPSKLE